jgi:hypothetical protein
MVFSKKAIPVTSFWICSAVVVFLSGLMAFVAEGAATITITQTTKYQTIDGLGAFAYMDGTWVGPANFFHDSLGGSMVRLHITPYSMQPNNNMSIRKIVILPNFLSAP